MTIPTIAAATRLLAAHKLSPVELVQDCLQRIEMFDPALCSSVTVMTDRALADARRAEAEIMAPGPRSRLHGIPYSLKDVFDTARIRTTSRV